MGLLALLIPSVSATALTYKLEAHEKACFYADVQQKDVKVAFYFAVSLDSSMRIYGIRPRRYEITVKTSRANGVEMYRFNPVAPSTSIIQLPDHLIKWFWMEPRNDRAISYSLPKALVNIASVSVTKCRLSRRNWWTLRLRYGHLRRFNITALLLRTIVNWFGMRLWLYRLRTSKKPSYRPDKVPVPNKPPRWKNPSQRFPISCLRSRATRNTSELVKTVTSALCAVLSGGFSTSASSKVWWWFLWLVCRFSLCASFSRVPGKVSHWYVPLEGKSEV